MSAHTQGTIVFLAILPTVERVARFTFRGMRDHHRQDDCVQETLALCWLWTCRLARQGKDARDFPTTLAGYAVRHVKSGRSLVGRKTYRSDALSPLARHLRGFVANSLPHTEGPPASPWQAALQDNTQSPPSEQAAFRIDFPAFLAELTDRDRRIAEAMMLGETTRELSHRFRVSPGRISQLRRELHDGWHNYTADAA